MRDAIDCAINALSTNRTSNDWIITLTDGDDNASHIDSNYLCNKISSMGINLIIIG